MTFAWKATTQWTEGNISPLPLPSTSFLTKIPPPPLAGFFDKLFGLQSKRIQVLPDITDALIFQINAFLNYTFVDRLCSSGHLDRKLLSQ